MSRPNNSPAEGKLFYDAVNLAGDTKLTVTGVTGCAGGEGIACGTDPDSGDMAPVAIQRDINTNCHN
jgi:hypothetical protein